MKDLNQVKVETGINGAMITMARQYRGASIAHMARYTKIPAKRISDYERGTKPLTPEDFALIAEATSFPESFFYQETMPSAKIHICGSHGCTTIGENEPEGQEPGLAVM